MHLIKLLRPHQYIKNCFVLAPLFFVGKITDLLLLDRALWAFLAFCAAASAVYVLNDYRDIDDDQKHPIKKNRPLAAGVLSKKTAIAALILLLLVSQALALQLSLDALIILNIYIGLNVAYSFGLKHIALVDVSIIAIGFVLRLFMGAVATGVDLSVWIVIMTFLLALFIAFAKRRDDLLIYESTGQKMRAVIDGYSIKFLDSAISIMASVIIVSYIAYSTSAEVASPLDGAYLYLSVFFVIIGLLRYLQLALVMNDSGSPTSIALNDRFIQVTVISWVIVFALAIY